MAAADHQDRPVGAAAWPRGSAPAPGRRRWRGAGMPDASAIAPQISSRYPAPLTTSPMRIRAGPQRARAAGPGRPAPARSAGPRTRAARRHDDQRMGRPKAARATSRSAPGASVTRAPACAQGGGQRQDPHQQVDHPLGPVARPGRSARNQGLAVSTDVGGQPLGALRRARGVLSAARHLPASCGTPLAPFEPRSNFQPERPQGTRASRFAGRPPKRRCMRLCARRFDSTYLLPYLLPFLLLFLVPPGLRRRATAPTTDGGGRHRRRPPADAASDAPPAGSVLPTLTAGTALTGSVNADATWRGAIAVTGEVLVNAAKITIEAGHHLRHGRRRLARLRLELATWPACSPAAPRRRPSASAARRRRPATTSRSSWASKVTSDSVLEHVDHQRRRPDDRRRAGASGAGVLVKNVQVIRSGADGVHAADFKEGSERLTVMGASQDRRRADRPGGRQPVAPGRLVRGQRHQRHRPALRRPSTSTTTFRDPGVPYIQEQAIVRPAAAASSPSQAGVDYRLAVDQTLEVGWNSDDVHHHRRGDRRQAGPVRPRLGQRRRLRQRLLRQTRVRSDSVLKYVKVQAAAATARPALDIRAPDHHRSTSPWRGTRPASTSRGPGSPRTRPP